MKTGIENYYAYCHQRIIKEHGTAKRCENPDCKCILPKRYEWALKKGKSYSTDINDYMQLCPSCHRKYDYTQEQRDSHSKRMKNMLPTEKQLIALSKGRGLSKKPILQYSVDKVFIKEWGSLTEVTTSMKILQSSISNCLSNKSKTAGGFIWKLKS